MDRPHWLSPDELDAWRSFSLMQLQLFGLIGRELAADGLSYADYVVLAALSERPDRQASSGVLGRQLGWEKSRLSHHLARMEQRGLVARATRPGGSRTASVTMTTAGAAAIAAAAPAHVAVVRRHLVDLLDPAQMRALGEISRIVLERLPDGAG